MRLVLFSFDYAPLDGGIARLCTELRRGLADKAIEVSVLTATNGASVEEPGVRRIAGSRALREVKALGILASLPNDTTVLCGRWYPEGLLALLAGRRSVAILVHGAELLASRIAGLSALRAKLRRRVLTAARLVIANSRYTSELASSIAPEAHVVALPLGVDTVAFSPGDREASRARLGLQSRFVVSTVARVLPFKGHDTVISALARLPEKLRADFCYYVAGRGGHVEALQALCRELGVAQQVKFGGLVPEQSLVDVYRASDLFCLMTRLGPRAVEGFGLALLEAQSCGVPVLGSNAGGIPDAVADGQTGFLLDPADVAGVERHLLGLADDVERYRRMGEAGCARARSSATWEIYADKLLALLRDHISESQAPKSC